MIVVPFESWHLDFIQPSWPVMKEGLALEKASISYTAIEKGQIVIIAGIIPIWQGVAESFLIPSQLLQKYRIECIKNIKLNQESIRQKLNLHRLQTTVPSNLHQAIRWLEWLGYKRESTLRMWGPDKLDHYRYVRFFDGN